MKGNRRRDTQPELALRKAMHKRGLRYRVDFPVAAGSRRVRPDAVFTRQWVAVFLDGCFWHRCPNHGVAPRANSDYWAPKLARNVERDREVDAALGLGGWMVIRIWEHEDAEAAAERVEIAVRQAQPNRGLLTFPWVG
jgi:DNA mismatch endonuclease (patch repair protein)